MNVERALELLYADGWRLVGGYETESGTWLCCWAKSGRQVEGSGVTPDNALLSAHRNIAHGLGRKSVAA